MPVTGIEKRRGEIALRNECAQRLRPVIRHELESVYRLEKQFAYISERRPDWQDATIRRDHDVAEFRVDMAFRRWAPYLFLLHI